MAKLNRFPMQVSPEFKKKLDEIQKKIMMSRGEKTSLREITTKIVKSPLFVDIEKNIVKTDKSLDVDLKIKFDRRWIR